MYAYCLLSLTAYDHVRSSISTHILFNNVFHDAAIGNTTPFANKESKTIMVASSLTNGNMFVTPSPSPSSELSPRLL